MVSCRSFDNSFSSQMVIVESQPSAAWTHHLPVSRHNFPIIPTAKESDYSDHMWEAHKMSRLKTMPTMPGQGLQGVSIAGTHRIN